MSKAKNVFDLILKITKIIKEAERRIVEFNKYVVVAIELQKTSLADEYFVLSFTCFFPKSSKYWKRKVSEKAFFKHLKGVHISY